MKKIVYFMLAIIMLFVTIPMARAKAADTDQTWKDLYHNELRSLLNDSSKNPYDEWSSPVALVDIDLDGIPELLIGSAPGSSGFLGSDYIFTVKGGKLVALTGQSNVWGSSINMDMSQLSICYNPSTGETRVTNYSNNQAGWADQFYYAMVNVIANGQLEQEVIFESEDYTDDNDVKTSKYRVSGNEVTAKEYYSDLSAWDNGWIGVKIPSFNVSNSYLDRNTRGNYGIDGQYNQNIYNDAETVAFLNSYVPGPVKTYSSTTNIVVDGNKKDFNAYNIGDNNYIKLRDIAFALNGSKKSFDIGWNQSTDTISLQNDKAYTSVGGEMSAGNGLNNIGQPTTSSISFDGSPVTLTAYQINGNNYFKLSDIANLIGFGIGWDNLNNTASINTSAGYSA